MENDAPKGPRGFDVAVWVFLGICVVGLLAAIVIPNFVRSGHPPHAACVNNLRQIDGAKDQWAIEHKREAGAMAPALEVAEYIKGHAIPVCPDGGTYAVKAVGENPTCSIGGPRHSLPR
jgi:hypothetical protein